MAGPKIILEPDSFIGTIRILRLSRKTNGRYMYECECECGETFNAYKDHLLSGRTKSCPSCAAGKNLRGEVFGNWMVEARTGKNRNNIKTWRCRCVSCGNICEFNTRDLMKGSYSSCSHSQQLHDSSEDDYIPYF